jgi:hypothetical protein
VDANQDRAMMQAQRAEKLAVSERKANVNETHRICAADATANPQRSGSTR